MKPLTFNSNTKLATGMTVALVVWMLLGLIGSDEQDADTPPNSDEKLFAVEVENISQQGFHKTVSVRGRSEAIRNVLVAAEVDGQVIETPAEEGALVKQGDALCILDSQDRKLRLEQAKAQLNKAEIDYQGALSLKDKGFQSQTQIASAKANLALAKADVKATTLATEKLVIRAPFSGVVQERLIEAGGFIQRGTACAELIDLSVLKIVGQIPESALRSVSSGSAAQVVFASGEKATGQVKYLASAADSVTRTFKIEIHIDNPEYAFRDGLSADVKIRSDEILAHHISPSLLSLMSDDQISVKVIEGDNRVVEKAISIIGDDSDGVWVTGLNANTQIITIGQEYVSHNDKVSPQPRKPELSSAKPNNLEPKKSLEPKNSPEPKKSPEPNAELKGSVVTSPASVGARP